MRTIGITGGTGFVGHHVTRLLRDAGNQVVIFTRNPEKKDQSKDGITYCYWSPRENKCDLTCIQRVDAMVHLAGAGIAEKRWTKKRKEEIVKSRVETTAFLVDKLREHAPNCKTFISASAIGYYGADNNRAPFHESDRHADDFLGDTCKKWEHEAIQAADFVRTTILRFGIVLGREAGAFKEFYKPVKFGVKPVLGSGKQVISWIHIEDLVRFIYHCIRHEDINGIYNAVAPNPVTNKKLMDTIAQEKGGLAIPAPVPAAALKLMLGEMSTEVLKSCTVSADKMSSTTGFQFDYPDINSAVRQLLQS
ncbi:MAG: TIGR01777 family protein [Sphingobacteriales bacterium]|nr:MAG: TIGR01777 family protein [Sphingobacteriales bacterium]